MVSGRGGAIDECGQIDMATIEKASEEVIDHIVNIDLSTYQFDIEKLVDQAS